MKSSTYVYGRIASRMVMATRVRRAHDLKTKKDPPVVRPFRRCAAKNTHARRPLNALLGGPPRRRAHVATTMLDRDVSRTQKKQRRGPSSIRTKGGGMRAFDPLPPHLARTTGQERSTGHPGAAGDGCHGRAVPAPPAEGGFWLRGKGKRV